jgi:hypothetical protein
MEIYHLTSFDISQIAGSLIRNGPPHKESESSPDERTQIRVDHITGARRSRHPWLALAYTFCLSLSTSRKAAAA